MVEDLGEALALLQYVANIYLLMGFHYMHSSINTSCSAQFLLPYKDSLPSSRTSSHSSNLNLIEMSAASVVPPLTSSLAVVVADDSEAAQRNDLRFVHALLLLYWSLLMDTVVCCCRRCPWRSAQSGRCCSRQCSSVYPQ